jgi:hypothetical protein
LEKLGIDIERLKLMELSQFVLNRKTEDVRSELYDYLICHSIFHKQERGPQSKEEIHEALMELYGIEISSSLLDICLGRLVSSSSIIPIRNGEERYVISENRLNEISEHNRQYLDLRKDITQQFHEKISTKTQLSNEALNSTTNCLFSVLSSVFERYGSICSSIITGKVGNIKSVSELPDFQTICKEATKVFNDPVLRQIVEEQLRELFVNPTTRFTHFLFSMAQSYTIAQIMNIDPKLQSLELSRLSNKKLYLDTNVLVSLMCIAQEHTLVSDIIYETKNFGVQLVYTTQTEREYLSLLHSSKQLYEKIPTHKRSIIDKVEPLMENPFIRSYWMEWKSNDTRTWDGFIIEMEGFKEILRDKFGITCERMTIKSIQGSSEFDPLMQAVALADVNKSEAAVMHDTCHLLLVHIKRTEQDVDELGFNCYFLTRDYSLGTAERIAYENTRIPASLHIGIWYQMITPFISPKITFDSASNVYVRLLSSQFPSLTRSVSPNDLVDLMGLWMDNPEIDTETVRRIVGNRFVKEHLNELRQTISKDPDRASKLIDPILQNVIPEVQKRQKDESDKMKSEYDEKISKMKEQIESLESSPRGRIVSKPLCLIGICLFVLLIVSGFISSYLNFTLPEVFYWVLGVAGTALVAASVFGERVFEKFKHL